jgi:hypothetical protein
VVTLLLSFFFGNFFSAWGTTSISHEWPLPNEILWFNSSLSKRCLHFGHTFFNVQNLPFTHNWFWSVFVFALCTPASLKRQW